MKIRKETYSGIYIPDGPPGKDKIKGFGSPRDPELEKWMMERKPYQGAFGNYYWKEGVGYIFSGIQFKVEYLPFGNTQCYVLKDADGNYEWSITEEEIAELRKGHGL